MVTENILGKFGLIKDENNLKLKEIFKDGTKLKEIHIDAYSENPLINSSSQFMLLLRVIEKNALIVNDGNRLILKRNDKCGTYFVNALFPKISECFFKSYGNCFEFILRVRGLYFKVTILN